MTEGTISYSGCSGSVFMARRVKELRKYSGSVSLC